MLHRLQQRALSPCSPFLRHSDSPPAFVRAASARCLHLDHRVRLQNTFHLSMTGTDKSFKKINNDPHQMLIYAGFLRQAQSGIFHNLHLGYKVQEKIKKLIDKHMQSIGASRVSLSSISSPVTWASSGRFEKLKSELFVLQDRKRSTLLLSPTHEEEISTVVKQGLMSYKQLPVRLYQITRKYRDELRPRKGLLRSREFVMKDLYTFDLSVNNALETYGQVRDAYDRIFAELRLPLRVAEASSGDIGGDLSHEYHLPSPHGEDDVISCGSCGYCANSEVAQSRPAKTQAEIVPASRLCVWRGISRDRKTLVNVWYLEHPDTAQESDDMDGTVNVHSTKRIVPDLDGSVESVDVDWWTAIKSKCKKRDENSLEQEVNPDLRVVNLMDRRIPGLDRNPELREKLDTNLFPFAQEAYSKLTLPIPEFVWEDEDGKRLDLVNVRPGDACPKCESGSLTISKAIELGHTFHLGDRYSKPMKVTTNLPPVEELTKHQGGEEAQLYSFTGRGKEIYLQMGCHGIGVSRVMGAVAAHFADSHGLNWPRVIAPYEVAVVSLKDAAGAEKVYDVLAEPSASRSAPLDLVLDDRDKSPGWKLNDADSIGYPVVVVVGREWAETQRCEVQCRQLQFKELVALEKLNSVVDKLLGQL